MHSGSSQRARRSLLSLLLLSAFVLAQQQQARTGNDVVLDGEPVARREPSKFHNPDTVKVQRNGKDTAAFIDSSNERALATFAPDDQLLPSVRAHPARSPGASGGISRQSARSLQDWQVEDLILLATVDGKIYARERSSGAPRWELEVDRPMVQTTYHKRNRSDIDGHNESDLLWIVEPSQDGALYVYSPDARMGMHRLGLTVKQLVEELSPYAGTDPPVVYTAEKKNTLYTIDASNGNIIKMFSSAGSVTNEAERSCRKVNALESLEERECEPMGTLTIGRTEYTVGIQDKDSGAAICTISYFEWGPNNRDKDLQNQYATTLDNRYVYTKHDGSILALEHNRHPTSGRRASPSQALVYNHKFSSPVARVYDVVRPHAEADADSSDAGLVVLPQPVGPVNKEWPASDNVFINCTEAGSWYALSEQSYPLVTDGASRALCYTDDWYAPSATLGDNVFDNQRTKLVGLHPLSTLDSSSRSVAAIGAPLVEPKVPAILPPDSIVADASTPSIAPSQNAWTSSLPSPLTLIVMLLIGLTAMPQSRALLHALQKRWRSSNRTPAMPIMDHPVDVVEVKPSRIEDGAEAEALEQTNVEEAVLEEPQRRFPETAQETIFPVEPSKDDDSSEDSQRSLSPSRAPTPEPKEAGALPPTPATPATKMANIDSTSEGSPAKPEKKARRGVRGGRKLKEKKLEAEQAQQRRRGHSQTKRNSGAVELQNIPEDPNQTPKAMPAQVISVDASESPNVSGKIQINNLVINTDRLIGRGSAGTCVFEGTFGKRDVAVKRMLSQYYELASQEVVFLQENDDHRNVIRYYCQEKDQNFLYIAVELCQTSLWDLFNPHTVEPEKRDQFAEILTAIQLDVPRALKQIVFGLRHLHARRIIHRDIKPQNILIGRPTTTSKDPHLLISDFGLCKTLPENVSTLVDPTNNAGTIGWKAPELISQPKDTISLNGHSTSSTDGTGNNIGGVKRAADIFSLGCLFFWVLTNGCHPFDDKEGWAQMRELNIKKNNMQNMHKLDLGNDTEEPMQLITAMLAPRPEDRPTVNDILEHPFFWSPADRLNFLCDVSDHFERETRDPPSQQLEHLESYGSLVIEKGDFLKALPREFVDTLGKQRKYTGSRMLDLLRALRNKKNHYEDMPEEVKRRVGSMPKGYLNFWTVRFPKLLMAGYWIVRECGLADTERFKGYFEVKEYVQ